MKLLTVRVKIICEHITGTVVDLDAGQDMVFIGNQAVLVENDPEHRIIAGCANVSLTVSHALAYYMCSKDIQRSFKLTAVASARRRSQVSPMELLME